jgi:uridine phosphorylase
MGHFFYFYHMQYPPSELVLDSSMRVYHLGLKPENVSEKIILVGDQDRVSMISAFFDSIEHSSQHREFVCHTGNYKGKRISAISTGIGTDNIDITINELDALFNIDLKDRIEKKDKTSLKLIRIGTCGILQPEIPIHSYLLSTHAFGLDNIAHFYQIAFNRDEQTICNAIREAVRFPETIQPYLVEADPSLTQRLSSDKTFEGITVTSSGFYGPQGRQLRVPNAILRFNEKLTAFSYEDHQIVNFEMESSAIFSLGKAMGHQCATICLGVANRPRMEFSKGYANEMNALIEYVLERI